MPYVLIFKSYRGDELKYEERHYFSDLNDLYSYAAWRLKYAGTENSCNRYDIRVELTEVNNTPLAA